MDRRPGDSGTVLRTLTAILLTGGSLLSVVDGQTNLATGIYEALVTTAAGLTIAIPVLLLYQYLSSRVDGLIDYIDSML